MPPPPVATASKEAVQRLRASAAAFKARQEVETPHQEGEWWERHEAVAAVRQWQQLEEEAMDIARKPKPWGQDY